MPIIGGSIVPVSDRLDVSADDLALQTLLIRGDITHDEAVQCYRILYRHAQ